ncbi:fimbrial protein [Dryocola clanedunensis]
MSPCSTKALRRSSGLPLLLAFMISMAANAETTDGWDVDGEHADIYVEGMLTEAACTLDMASDFQQIELGNIPIGTLVHVGDRGEPVAFHLRLKDCLRVEGYKHGNRSGNIAWSSNQPVVTVAFLAPADADNAELVKVFGPEVNGVGLRLTDDKFSDIRLSTWGRPTFISPGQDTLTFYVAPERTNSRLVGGAFTATVNFQISYQ